MLEAIVVVVVVVVVDDVGGGAAVFDVDLALLLLHRYLHDG
jgi:hypothetical protein